MNLFRTSIKILILILLLGVPAEAQTGKWQRVARLFCKKFAQTFRETTKNFAIYNVDIRSLQEEDSNPEEENEFCPTLVQQVINDPDLPQPSILSFINSRCGICKPVSKAPAIGSAEHPLYLPAQ